METATRSAGNSLQCLKCEELLKEPVTLPCGHSVCRACVTNDRSMAKCPSCEVVYGADLRINVTLWTVIQKLYGKENCVVDRQDGFGDEASEIPALEPNRVSIEDLECTICRRLFYLPISTTCGHVFCRHCLDRCLDHDPKCPLCKNSLDDHLAERRQATVHAIEKIIEFCFPDELAERRRLHYDNDIAASATFDDGQFEVPVFVCTLGFPSVPCPLHIFEPRYRLMMRRAVESGTRQFCMCVHTGSSEGSFADVGIMMIIRDIEYLPDGRSLVDTVGGRRVRVITRDMRDGYHTAIVQYLSDTDSTPDRLEELNTKSHQVYSMCHHWFNTKINERQKRQIVSQYGEFPEEDALEVNSADGPSWVWWIIAVLPLNSCLQLVFLRMTELEERLSGVDNTIKFMASGRMHQECVML